MNDILFVSAVLLITHGGAFVAGYFVGQRKKIVAAVSNMSAVSTDVAAVLKGAVGAAEAAAVHK